MPRTPDPVDPAASPWHLFGAGLRHWREQRGLTLQQAGAETLGDWSNLARWERGERKPSTDAVKRLDRLYGADGFLVALHASALANVALSADSASPAQWDGVGMDLLRRRLLAGMAAVGAAAAVPPMDGLESLRTIIDHRIGRPRIGDWEESAWEYAHLVFSSSIHEVIRDLSVDLLALQQAMTSVASTEMTRWLRVNTQMTMLLAYALGCAGQARESHHWWRSAQRSADQTGDHELLALVYAREAVQALHEGRPVPLVLSRITKALELTQGRPCVATSQAYGARAHAFALVGNTADAYIDLEAQARVYDCLPDAVTSDRQSIDGWPETRLLYSRSLVYTLKGHCDVDEVQQEAINAYPSESSRQRAQVELHRAHTEVRRGHIDSGLEHAGTVLTRMSPDLINRFVLHNAAFVASAVPAVEHTRSTAVAYRELLMSSATKRN
ncbi:helix-turn-helix domain-containing protein [Sphaerisporangium viridialbum]|uniref:helix-turn-helix domain-containing protein n=1 Tax=Sphaerisporangium viridialbum TaxID=46189 RepID=UPI003C78BB01